MKFHRATIAVSLLFAALCGGLAQNALGEPLRLGLVLPLTGPRASIGEDARQAAELAEQDLLAAGQLSAGRIQLVFEDSSGDPAKGVSAYRNLLRLGSRFIISQNSNISLPISQLVNRDKVLQLAITTTANTYSQAQDLTFRTNGSARLEAEVMAKFLQSQLDGEKDPHIALLSMEDEYPLSLRKDLAALLNEKNIVPKLDDTFFPQETDYRALVAKMKQQKINYIILLSYQQQAGYFVRQIAEQQLNPRLILTNIPVNNREFFEVAKEASEGVRCTSLAINRQHPAVGRFQKRYHKDMNPFSANSYDAVALAARAMKECQYETNTACWKESLFRIKDFNGASGVKSFDDTFGEMQDRYEILIARGQKFVSAE